MAEVKKLSATKVSMYNKCPRVYRFNYIDHFKVPTKAWNIFGSQIHYMLKRFYDVNFKSSDSFVKFWRHNWLSAISGENLKGKRKKELETQKFKVNDNFNLEIGNHVDIGNDPVGVFFGYMRRGENILRNFYIRHKDKEPPIKTEMSFGKKEDMFFGDHKITGVIDRVDRIKRKLCVIDYKTGKISPAQDPELISKNIQFTFYSYGVRQIFHEKEKLFFYHLMTNEIFPLVRKERDYDSLKKTLDKVAQGIICDSFDPIFSENCKNCPYEAPCGKN